MNPLLFGVLFPFVRLESIAFGQKTRYIKPPSPPGNMAFIENKSVKNVVHILEHGLLHCMFCFAI